MGFGRPPKHTRFKKGQSGKPRGRPKGSKNVKTIVQKALMKPVKVREGQRVRTLPWLAAVFQAFMAKAAGGDMKAFQLVYTLASREGWFDEPLPAQQKATEPEEPVREKVARMLSEIHIRLQGHVEMSPWDENKDPPNK